VEPPADIRAVADVLRRRDEDHVPEEHRVLLDLRRTNLQGAELQGANLEEVHLFGTNLEKAYLTGAHLQGANLIRANLQGADLEEAHLEKAKLALANLQGADLTSAHLQGAMLWGADLRGADLSGADGIPTDQLEWTIGSNETDLGEYRNHPELWNKSYEEQVKIVSEHIGGG
jgi:uncharacterized protein YjbI with pentapeptide repeats